MTKKDIRKEMILRKEITRRKEIIDAAYNSGKIELDVAGLLAGAICLEDCGDENIKKMFEEGLISQELADQLLNAEVKPQETVEAKQEIIINKMIERINFKIGLMNSLFTGWSDFHALRMAEIDGMIDMLSIATGKEYAVTENGLIEMDE